MQSWNGSWSWEHLEVSLPVLQQWWRHFPSTLCYYAFPDSHPRQVIEYFKFLGKIALENSTSCSTIHGTCSWSVCWTECDQDIQQISTWFEVGLT